LHAATKARMRLACPALHVPEISVRNGRSLWRIFATAGNAWLWFNLKVGAGSFFSRCARGLHLAPILGHHDRGATEWAPVEMLETETLCGGRVRSLRRIRELLRRQSEN